MRTCIPNLRPDGCFTNLSRDTLVMSRIDNGMISNNVLVSIIERVNSTSLVQANIYKGRSGWLGRPRASLLKKFKLVSSNLLPPRDLFSVRFELVEPRWLY